MKVIWYDAFLGNFDIAVKTVNDAIFGQHVKVCPTYPANIIVWSILQVNLSKYVTS